MGLVFSQYSSLLKKGWSIRLLPLFTANSVQEPFLTDISIVGGTYITNSSMTFFQRNQDFLSSPPPGGGVLPYMGYIGSAALKGMVFPPFWS